MRLLQTANVVIKKMSIPPLVLLVQRLILWHHADGDGADNDYDGTNDADANLNVHNFIDMVHCAFLLAIMRKTTLLTMLQQQWSQHWQSPNQDRFMEFMMFLSCSLLMLIIMLMLTLLFRDGLRLFCMHAPLITYVGENPFPKVFKCFNAIADCDIRW